MLSPGHPDPHNHRPAGCKGRRSGAAGSLRSWTHNNSEQPGTTEGTAKGHPGSGGVSGGWPFVVLPHRYLFFTCLNNDLSPRFKSEVCAKQVVIAGLAPSSSARIRLMNDPASAKSHWRQVMIHSLLFPFNSLQPQSIHCPINSTTFHE